MNTIKKIFTFDAMLTPKLTKFLFGLGVMVSIAYGLLIIIAGLTNDLGFVAIIGGLLFMVVSPLFVRIWTELILVPFEILKELKKINNK